MILVPSLELLDGALVRLRGGADAEPTVLGTDPLQTARELHRSGAMFFHVVDLDAVLGKGNNDEVLSKFVEAMIPFQVRGAVDAGRAEAVLKLGADRVVLGALPFVDGKAAKKLVDKFGMRVAAALDVKRGKVRFDAGDERKEIELPEALDKLRKTGVAQVIYNSVESPGEDAALDRDKLMSVIQDGAFQVYLRCTVQSPAEMDPLQELNEQGLLGVILNHALASDSVPFSELVAVAS